MTVSEANWSANPGAYTLGDGSSTLRVPDYRGLTIKGHHDGSNARTTNTTRALGSYEADEVKRHNHTYAAPLSVNNISLNNIPGYVGRNDGFTSLTGGPENTVRNASALICIRAY